jgi:hypothetical protein
MVSWARRGFLLAVLLVTASAAGCQPGAQSTPQSHTLSGSIEVKGFGGVEEVDSQCVASGGYSDIRKGVDVVLRNEAGTILGDGSLGAGTTTDPDGYVTCHFAFEIAGVPDAKFYSIKIGKRDGPTYSLDELSGKGWQVLLTLG